MKNMTDRHKIEDFQSMTNITLLMVFLIGIKEDSTQGNNFSGKNSFIKILLLPKLYPFIIIIKKAKNSISVVYLNLKKK